MTILESEENIFLIQFLTITVTTFIQVTTIIQLQQ
jgi:hypothetical protein